MTFKEKIELAESKQIIIPSELANGENIVGVYKIFGVKDGISTCLYIGKSTNISNRLLGSGGRSYLYVFE